MVISMSARHLFGTVLDTVLKIVIIVAVVMFVYKYASQAYEFGYRVFAEQPVSSAEDAKMISIAITEEATATDIGKVLEQKGLIQSARLFSIQEMLSGYHDELRPGIYELSSDMTAEEMMAVMAAVPEEDAEESSEEETGADTESTGENTDSAGDAGSGGEDAE